MLLKIIDYKLALEDVINNKNIYSGLNKKYIVRYILNSDSISYVRNLPLINFIQGVWHAKDAYITCDLLVKKYPFLENMNEITCISRVSFYTPDTCLDEYFDNLKNARAFLNNIRVI